MANTSGIMDKPVDCQEYVNKEQENLEENMSRYSQFSIVKEYVSHVSFEIEDMVLHETPIPERAWLPSSSEAPSPPKVAPSHRDPLPGTVPNRLGKFIYPTPPKRARAKTCMSSAPASAGPMQK
jgi:hypothetical protein